MQKRCWKQTIYLHCAQNAAAICARGCVGSNPTAAFKESCTHSTHRAERRSVKFPALLVKQRRKELGVPNISPEAFYAVAYLNKYLLLKLLLRSVRVNGKLKTSEVLSQKKKRLISGRGFQKDLSSVRKPLQGHASANIHMHLHLLICNLERFLLALISQDSLIWVQTRAAMYLYRAVTKQ